MRRGLTQAIINFQQKLQTSNSLLARLVWAGCLMVAFIAMAIVHAWDLLFLPPQTSFERFNYLDKTNGYTGSYTSHRRWKHNVRFGALSYSLVLITAVTFTTTVVQLLGSDSVQVAFAATQTVNSTNDVNDGACNVIHCSLREAINAVNGTPGQNVETIEFSNLIGDTITLQAALPIINKSKAVVDGGNRMIIDCNNTVNRAFVFKQPDSVLKNITVSNCTDAAVAFENTSSTPTVTNSTFIGNKIGVEMLNSGLSGATISNSTFTNNASDGSNPGNRGTGIKINNRSGVDIDNNSFNGNEIGVTVTGGSNITITNNTLCNTDYQGLLLTNNVASSTISENTLGCVGEGNGGDMGINLISANNNIIENNVIQNNSVHGINLNGADSNIIAGNTIESNGEGVFFNGDADFNVIGSSTTQNNTSNSIISNKQGGITGQGGDASNNQWRLNTINTNTIAPVILENGSNNGVQAPAVTTFIDTRVGGTGVANGQYVDIYNAPDDALWTYVATVAVDANGEWEYEADFTDIEKIAVMQTTEASSAFTTFSKQEQLSITGDVIVGSITSSSATVTWTTNIEAIGKIMYSVNADDITNNVGTIKDAETGANPSTAFTAQLTELEPNTQYFYKVIVYGPDDQTVESATQNFTTLTDGDEPVDSINIESVSASSITKNSVTLHVETDVESQATFNLGTTVNYGRVQNSSELATNHSVTFANLQPNTTYHYQVAVNNDSSDTVTSADKTFTTLRVVEDSINTFTITSKDFTETIVGGDDVHIDVPHQKLEFELNNVKEGNIVQFVVEKYNKKTEQATQQIINKKKAADEKNKVNFTVKKKQLELGQAYLVSTGTKNVALTKRFTFTPQYPRPQLVFPKPQFGDAVIVNSIPEEFVAYAPHMPVGTSISFNILNRTDNSLQVRCTGVTNNEKLARCAMPFFPAAGVYTLDVKSAAGDSIANALEFIVSNGVSDTISLDTRSGQRITTSTSPTLAFLKYKSNSTLTMEASFLSGPYVLQGPTADNGGKVISGSSKFTLFPWPKGTFEVHVVEKMPNGKVIQDHKIKVWGVHKAVQPGVIAPANDTRFSINDEINLTVASPNDYKIQLFQTVNGSDRLVYETISQNGGATINLNEFIGQRTGTQAFTLRGISPSFFKSAFTPFSVVTYRPAPIVIPPEPDTDEPDLTSSETTGETETTDPDTGTSTEPDTNTNSNTNVNTNTEPDTNTNTTPDVDTDGDGLTDKEEDILGTNENTTDTDSDGIPDGEDADPGVVVDPITPGELDGNLPDVDGDGTPDVGDEDIDGDGVNNAEEETIGTDPTIPDTDTDGVTDGEEVANNGNPTEVDSDNDGLGDGVEVVLGTDPNNPDTDGDGIIDGQDAYPLRAGIDEEVVDIDADGLSDEAEEQYGSDPEDTDSDDDGLLDGIEDGLGTNPIQKDSDSDGLVDPVDGRLDVALPDQTILVDQAQADANAYYQASGLEEPTLYSLTKQVIPLNEAQVAAVSENLTEEITTNTDLEIVPGSSTTVSDGEVPVITVKRVITIADIIAWLFGRFKEAVDDTVIVLSGVIEITRNDTPVFLNSLPTVVSATVFSQPTVQIAQAQSDGKWTMTVPTELLSTGEHTIYAASEINGVNGDQVEIARFVIEQEAELSKTTWLVIVNVGIALIALIISIFLQLRKRTKIGGLSNEAG